MGYRFQAKMIILDHEKLGQIICGLEKMACHEHLHHKSERLQGCFQHLEKRLSTRNIETLKHCLLRYQKVISKFS